MTSEKRDRELKGAFYTPPIWVELSQKYLADVLGEDWQDEYYIWDCAAGTGNLLAGLTNKYKVFASTLDRQDVDVMHDRIANGANLLEKHVFQFDFLNDDFSKLPKNLQTIIQDPEECKKLIMYINPPYAEASSYGEHSIPQVANETKIFHDFKKIAGAEAMNEIFAQFFVRIYKEIPNSKLASFSKVKYITSEKFTRFKTYFRAKYQKGFIVPANSFDNVKGEFPIGFLIWDLAESIEIKQIKTDVFIPDKKFKTYKKTSKKKFYTIKNKSIADWRKTFYDRGGKPIAYMIIVGPSMQSNSNTFITNQPAKSYQNKGMVANITQKNLIQMSIYLSIRHCIATTWINDRDQFLYPNKKWEKATEFQNDCLAFTLFHGQNRIRLNGDKNHWIPFTEQEVKASAKFESNFMSQFIAGKLKIEGNGTLLDTEKKRTYPLKFSKQAQEVFEAGKKLWQYYFSEPHTHTTPSLYDIRERFQGKNKSGKMNSNSEDQTYTKLIGNLREKLKDLAKKIEPKVYEYGFLKK